jgi:predicted porin
MGGGNIFATKWGLKGVEDLGGGYATIFKLENGFNSANGQFNNNGALFGREAWVGLTGPFGGLQAGETYTILHTSFVTYSMPGLGASLAWGNAANNFVGPSYQRVSNALRYT